MMTSTKVSPFTSLAARAEALAARIREDMLVLARRATKRYGALYALQTNHPRTGRREAVAVAFGLVNAYYIKRELYTVGRPVFIVRVM